MTRSALSGPGSSPPAALVTFDGRAYSTVADWDAAFDGWLDARDAWCAEHPGIALPEKVLGVHPLKVQLLLLHAGVWSGGRCAEHSLRPNEH